MKKALTLICVVIPIFILVAIWVWTSYDLRERRQSAIDAQIQRGQALTQRLEGRLRDVVRKLEARSSEFNARFADDIEQGHADKEAVIEDELRRWAERFPEIQGIQIANDKGIYIYDNNDQSIGVNITDRDHFTRLRDGRSDRLIASEPVISKVSGRWATLLAYRLENRKEQFLGVITAAIDSRYFEQYLANMGSPSGESIAVWTSHELMFSWPSVTFIQGKRVYNPAVQGLIVAGKHAGSFIERDPVSGDEFIVTVGNIKLQGVVFVVTVARAKTDVLAHWRSVAVVYCLGACLATFLVITAIYLIVGQIRHKVNRTEEELKALWNSTPDSVSVAGRDGRYIAVNERFCELMGMSSSEVVGRRTEDLFPPEEAEILNEAKKEIFEQDRDNPHLVTQGTVWITHRNAPRAPFMARRIPVFDADGKVWAVCTVMCDLSEQLTAQARGEMLSGIIDNDSDGLLFLDAKGQINIANHAVVELLGCAEEDLLAHSVEELLAPQHDEEFVKNMLLELKAGNIWSGELCFQAKNGTQKQVLARIVPMVDSRLGQMRSIVFVRDISALKKSERRVDALIHLDVATGLPSRAGLVREIKQCMLAKESAVLIVLSVSQIGRISVIYGHDAASLVLRRIGGRMRRLLREQDLIGRLGDDLFGIFIRGISPVNVEHVVVKLMEVVFQPLTVREQTILCTPYAGMCMVVPAQIQDAEVVLQHANAAMMHARDEGAGAYRFFAPEMNEQLVQHMRRETELRKALERGEFRLYYQPQVDIVTGRTVGCEVLIRWEHPERGIVSPNDFIPLAEESELILPIGIWVLEQACVQAMAWRGMGFDPIVIAINLSVKQFQDVALLDVITNTLDMTGMEARWLDLEITESCLMKNPERVIPVLENLKTLGVSLSIDDFGTGYSSLSYLKRFPVDKIKIDRSFLQDVCRDHSDAAIVRMVIGMAEALELCVIAEGVEEREQLEFLAENHCQQYQGYLFGKPVPAELFELILRAQSAHGEDRVRALPVVPEESENL